MNLGLMLFNVLITTGLLIVLEKMQSSLTQCQSALVKFVEGLRTKCPWFYLLPLDDILQLTCYGECNIINLKLHVHVQVYNSWFIF